MDLPTLLQRLAATAAGGSAARLGYRAMASVAARRLARHPAVDGVYLYGSATRSGHLRPGFSDVDLVALAELPSLDHELELRRQLAAELRVLGAVRPLFKHVDYFELRDLEYMRRLGYAWSLDLDRAWRCLAGTDRLGSSARMTPQKRKLELLISALRRWQGSSSFLADPGNGRTPGLNAIGARRTLGDVLAAWLDVDRFQPLDRLFALLGERAAGETLRELARDPAPLRLDAESTVEACLVASLEALETFAAEVSAGWSAGWPQLEIALPLTLPPSERDALARVALGEGFTAVAVAPDRYGRAVPFAVADAELSPRRALSALRRVLELRRRESAAWPRPVLLTPALWRAAAALDPAPFAGAALALRAETALDAPGAPPASVWDDLIVGRAVQMLVRPRGRGLRLAAGSSSGTAKLAYEVRRVAPVLAHLLRSEPALLAPLSVAPGNEASLVGELRAWCDRVRPELDRRLE